MKITYVNRTKLCALALAGTLSFSLVGCGPRELAPERDNVDVLDPSISLEDDSSLARGCYTKFRC